MPLEVRNQFQSNPVSLVPGVSISRIFTVARSARGQVPKDLCPGAFQEGTDEQIVEYRMNTRQPFETGSAGQTHEHGFSLVVQVVAQGDLRGPYSLGRSA